MILRLLQLLKHTVIQYPDAGSLHARRTGFNHSGAFEFPERIDNYGAGDSRLICDLAGYQRALVSLHLLKDQKDCFQLCGRKSADGRLHNLFSAFFFCIFFMYRAHHLQSHDRRTIFTQNNIINVIGLFRFIQKQRPQPLSCNIDGRDQRLIVPDIPGFKSQCP